MLLLTSSDDRPLVSLEVSQIESALHAVTVSSRLLTRKSSAMSRGVRRTNQEPRRQRRAFALDMGRERNAPICLQTW